MQMNQQSMTQEEIRIAGIRVLGEHMGLVDMIRFLQQTETGHGDYTAERSRLLGDPTVDDLFADIEKSGANSEA
jgi:hypothetical protein